MLPALVLTLFNSCSHEETTDADVDYMKEVATWRATRIERLKSPTGWLTLVGLFPLSEGDNTLGSAVDNQCVFPAGAPERVGTARLEGDRVTFTAAPGAHVSHDSVEIENLELVPDPDSGAVILHVANRFEFLHILRAGKHYIRLKDAQAEALKHFDSLPHYPVNVALCLEARWEKYPTPRTATIPNVLGFDTETPITGAAVFEWNGTTYRLEPDEADDDAYFFVFGDATNGKETYGGGRFMYMDPPDSTGMMRIDFNRAYNPPCVFTPYATCPLPRSENVLPFKVEAGELAFAH